MLVLSHPSATARSADRSSRRHLNGRLRRAQGERSSSLQQPDKRGLLVTYTIAEPCIDVKDKACVEECPVDCIYEGPRMLYIHPEECIDCGACEPVCPVEAIFYEDDVPEEWAEFTPINAEYFEDSHAGVGSPGGAAGVGSSEKDHSKITTWE
jgi:ferredoxin